VADRAAESPDPADGRQTYTCILDHTRERLTIAEVNGFSIAVGRGEIPDPDVSEVMGEAFDLCVASPTAPS
jgi:hypothetical protein